METDSFLDLDEDFFLTHIFDLHEDLRLSQIRDHSEIKTKVIFSPLTTSYIFVTQLLI